MSAVEEKIGVVTDSRNRVGVAVVRLTDGDLRLGDRVKITGRTTELTQTVESLQIEHRGVEPCPRCRAAKFSGGACHLPSGHAGSHECSAVSGEIHRWR